MKKWKWEDFCLIWTKVAAAELEDGAGGGGGVETRAKLRGHCCIHPSIYPPSIHPSRQQSGCQSAVLLQCCSGSLLFSSTSIRPLSAGGMNAPHPSLLFSSTSIHPPSVGGINAPHPSLLSSSSIRPLASALHLRLLLFLVRASSPDRLHPEDPSIWGRARAIIIPPEAEN